MDGLKIGVPEPVLAAVQLSSTNSDTADDSSDEPGNDRLVNVNWCYSVAAAVYRNCSLH